MIRADRLREWSRSSLWFLPASAAVASLVLGLVLSSIRLGPDSPLAFQGTADDARSLLITIAGTMVTVIALLLGLAVVALQLSSTQFSPRLLRNFLRDRPNQIALSVFVGTFTYSAAGLFDVGISRGQRIDVFPRLAVTVAMALMFLGLGLLVFFADHLAHSLQIDNILRVVERNTLRVTRTLPAGTAAPPVPRTAEHILSRTSGYVQAVDTRRLLAVAARTGVSVRFRPRVGEHVVTGTTLARVWSAAGPVPGDVLARFAGTLHACIRIGFERTLEQDPGLGMRQLVDAACKALSPAVNDPYTAIQAIDHLSVIYVELARRRVGVIVVADDSGEFGPVSLTVPARSLAEHLELGMGLIRRYGAGEPTVIRALLRCLDSVLRAGACRPEDRAAISVQARLLLTAAERETRELADLDAVRAEFGALEQALHGRGDAVG